MSVEDIIKILQELTRILNDVNGTDEITDDIINSKIQELVNSIKV